MPTMAPGWPIATSRPTSPGELSSLHSTAQGSGASHSTVRVPGKFPDTQRLEDSRPPEVPRNIIKEAFHVFDTDLDESVTVEDLLAFVQQHAVGFDEATVRNMFDEATAAGFSGPITARHLPEFHKRMVLRDLVRAIGFRRQQVEEDASLVSGRSRKREWLSRPYQQHWLKMVEMALPGRAVLLGPQFELYSEPIATQREREGDPNHPNAPTMRAQTAGSAFFEGGRGGGDGFTVRTGTTSGWHSRQMTWTPNPPPMATITRKRPRRKSDGALAPPELKDSMAEARALVSNVDTFTLKETDDPVLRALYAGTPKQRTRTADDDAGALRHFGFHAQQRQQELDSRLWYKSEARTRSIEVRQGQGQNAETTGAVSLIASSSPAARRPQSVAASGGGRGQSFQAGGSSVAEGTKSSTGAGGLGLGGGSGFSGDNTDSGPTVRGSLASTMSVHSQSLLKRSVNHDAAARKPGPPSRGSGLPMNTSISHKSPSPLAYPFEHRDEACPSNGFELRLRAEDQSDRVCLPRGKPTHFKNTARRMNNQELKTRIAVDQHNIFGKSTQGRFGPEEPHPYIHSFRAPPRPGTVVFRGHPVPINFPYPDEKVAVIRSTDGTDWNMFQRTGGARLDRRVR